MLSLKVDSMVMDVQKKFYSLKGIVDFRVTNNTGFERGFSYNDWQNSSSDQSNLEPY